jgi:hypothetical protein
MSTPETFEGLGRYGLQANPYVAATAPLDPLRTGRVLSRRIDGITRDLHEIEGYIDRAVEFEEPAFVLIQGKSGTGRTSVCNHLLRHHCNALRVQPARYLVPATELAGQGQDPFAIFKRWLILLRGDIPRAGLEQLGKYRGADLDGELRDLPRVATDLDTFATEARLLMSAVTTVLKSKSAGLGVCFEGVKDYGLLNIAFEAFADAQTLVVATILDYPSRRTGVTQNFRARAVSGLAVEDLNYPVLNLDKITGEEAKDLIQFHWEEAADGVDSPFEDAGLVASFGDKPRPAGRVLKVTSKVLNFHAESVGPGPAWPEDRQTLFFAHDTLARLVPLIDDAVPEPVEEDDD